MKLEVAHLNKSFGEKTILKDINITFEEGKIYGLLGRNGAGKTTFFNALNEDIDIDSGKFFLETEYGNNKLQTQDIGYVLSTPIVPEFLTGKEFLQFILDIKGNYSDKTIDELFDLVKISSEDQDKLLKDYSQGMKNKIQILVNVVSNPKVILLDEPLTSLDIVVQEEMKKLLKDLKKHHVIIFSTHILELALDLCDEIVILSNKNMKMIEKKQFHTKKFRDEIINQLKDDYYEE